MSEKNGYVTVLELPNRNVTDVIEELFVTYAVEVHGSVRTIENEAERQLVVLSSDLVVVAVI